MSGGAGNDTYYVDNAGDTVTETSALVDEIDLVSSTVTFKLGDNIENLILTGTLGAYGTGNNLDNMLTGNTAANSLVGGSGNDTLNGGTGADTMDGGDGDDLYYIDNVGDKISDSNGLDM